jgi:mRNA-degrading endonuclease RelE of RelBE toxin-antitoxin system
MPPPTLKIPSPLRELIQHLHPHLKRKIRAALTDILVDPACGKPLKEELSGYWSLRVGQLRVIYRPDQEGVEIVALGPRRTIYADAARQLLRRRRQS